VWQIRTFLGSNRRKCLARAVKSGSAEETMVIDNANGPIHILIVDDDEVGRLNARRVLQRLAGIGTVTEAPDGAEALMRLRSGELPQRRLVVLLDLSMPGMGGLDVLREIRADPDLQAIPVVIMTRSGAAPQIAEAFRLHAAGYILKPATMRHLVACLDSFVTYWSHVEFPARAQA
jgi:CheY-like chemotaxis protein